VTGENKKENLAVEIEKSTASLRAAELCLAAGLFDDAVSRAYYAAYHMAQALAFSEGLEARTHGGLHDLVYLTFVRTGRLAAEVAKDFAALQRFRESADYARAFHFDQAQASEEVERARALCRAMRALLVAGGWTTTPEPEK
jgi:hypothetical protein